MTRLFTSSIRNYLQAEAETGQSVGFHQTGSLRLATSEAELKSYEALKPLFQELDVPYHVIDPGAVKSIYPLLSTDGVFGAAHTPTDGHVDASGATHALARGARQMGAEIRTNTPVDALEKTASGWRVTTGSETILAENIVLAASFWTRELAQQIGLNLPLFALQHHEIITGPVPELASLKTELPTVRDPAAPANIRQERDGFLCGVYEQGPKFWATDGIPADFREELLPPELDRLTPELERVIHRIPAFGEAGIKAVNNGPICYTPDGLPLLGPVGGQDGLWLASGFTIGIGTGGGAGQFLAQWMADGKPGYDLPAVYPSRFGDGLRKEDALRQIKATYERGYRLT
jgi:dimethylglycine dehydrogenase